MVTAIGGYDGEYSGDGIGTGRGIGIVSSDIRVDTTLQLKAGSCAEDAEQVYNDGGDLCSAFEGKSYIQVGNGPVKYLNEKGIEQTCTDYTFVDSKRTTLSAGWYFIGYDIIPRFSYSIEGDVHLILADGITLDVKGIRVPSGNSLTIYGQAEGTAVLNTTGTSYAAGIGGQDTENSGNITINRGTINATGGQYAAGIGGGRGGTGSNIKINGGTVTATGKNGGAGIGSGNNGGNAEKITVNTELQVKAGESEASAKIITNSGDDLAGAFSGNAYAHIEKLDPVKYIDESGTEQTVSDYTVVDASSTGEWSAGWYVVRKDVTLTNAQISVCGGVNLILMDGVTFTVTGADGYAGIGVSGTGNSLKIYSQRGNTGKLKAAGGANGAGIGGGNGEAGMNITVIGGRVEAIGGSDAVGVGSGNGGGDASNIVFNKGVSAYIGNTFTKMEELEEGTSWAKTLADQERVVVSNGGVEYLDENGDKWFCLDYTVVTEQLNCDWVSGWYVVNNFVSIDESVISIDGSVHLILASNGWLDVTGKTERDIGLEALCYAGITVGLGDSLTIYGQSNGGGRLDSQGGDFITAGREVGGGAGIGGQGFNPYGNITINGGTVYANGSTSSGGAGIGSGSDSSSTRSGTITINGGNVKCTGGRCSAGIGGGSITSASNIIITGGTVYAYGDEAAGIGGGNGESGNNITISGGTVYAYGGVGSAGIGGGDRGSGNNITISGGTVYAYGDSGAGIGGGIDATGTNIAITGGKVQASSKSGDGIGNGKDATGSEGITAKDVTPIYAGSSFGTMSLVTNETPGTTDLADQFKGNQCAALGYEAIDYVDAEGNTKYCFYTELTSSMTTLGSSGTETWYFLKDDVSISDTVTVNGTVNLVLADGKTLTVTGTSNKAGVNISGSASLTVFGQTSATGRLKVTGGENGAGISGNALTVHGVKLEVSGGSAGTAGISVKTASVSSTLAGTVLCGNTEGAGALLEKGSGLAAALKGGRYTVIGHSGDTVEFLYYYSDTKSFGTQYCYSYTTVDKTTVGVWGTAGNTTWYVVDDKIDPMTNEITAAGDVHLILTDTGKMTVTGTENKAAIGVTGSENSFTIYGQTNGTGELNVTGGNDGAGIGGGKSESGSNITITGGKVKAAGGSESADGIGSGLGGSPSANIQIISGLVLTGTSDPPTNEITKSGDISEDLAGNRYVWVGYPKPIEYIDEDGTLKYCLEYTLVDGTIPATWNEGWYVVSENAVLDETITINGNVHLILTDGKTFTVNGTADNAGINVTGKNSLAVYGQTKGSGALNVTGGANGSGIGGGNGTDGENITINGGLITAVGTDGGAGIGGGNGGAGSNIKINGGTVSATGGDNAAGIGSGCEGSDASNITVSTYLTTMAGASASKTELVENDGDDLAEKLAGSAYVKIVTPVKYIDENGEEQTCGNYTVVDEKMTGEWAAGWYVVNSDVTMTEAQVTCNGDVHLILVDGFSLTVTGNTNFAGIGVTGDSNSLTIYGQTEGTGKLTATGGNFGAGIGGGNGGAGSNIKINGGTVNATGIIGSGIGGGYLGEGSGITINGGTVTANGGEYGSGIGGGAVGTGSNITINGGTVNANGGDRSSGIGGGAKGAGSNITISGGTVTANGGDKSAGIGGGYEGNGSNITISGGTVTANGNGGSGIGGGRFGAGTGITISGGTVNANGGNFGRECGSGIGGGYEGNGSNITISGGTVTANGGQSAAGIGGGDSGAGSDITISGGTVTATGGYCGSGIGGGYSGEGSDITITGGTVTATGGEYGSGIGGGYLGEGSDITITGGTVTAIGNDGEFGCGAGIGSGRSGSAASDIYISTDLTTKAGASASETDLITNTGGDLAGTLAPYPYVKILPPVKYIDEKGKEQTCKDYTIVDSSMTGKWAAGWYVVNSDVTMTEAQVTCNGDVHLILADGFSLTVTGNTNFAGIGVTGDDNSLTIYGQTEGTGELTANGGQNGAGIGGGTWGTGSNITITGGTVTATGNIGGAGIGGGAGSGGRNGGAGSDITISGGTVIANSFSNPSPVGSGAGIGGGNGGAGSNITISGGTVIANSTSSIGSGAGVGGGFGGTGSDITISGGTVIANSTSSFGSGVSIGSGNNGSAASDIYISTDQVTTAGSSASDAKLIINTGGDLAGTLADKAYVKIQDPVTVTSGKDDDSEGTLRWALSQESAKIIFDSSLSGKTITFASELTISKEVIIDASALEKGITLGGKPVKIDAENNSVFITGVTFTLVASSGDDSAALHLSQSKAVTLSYCQFKGCDCDTAAIYLESSDLTMLNCLVAGNKTEAGLYAAASSTVKMTNCTVADNSNTSASYGLFAAGSSAFNVYNCIITGHKNDVDISNGTANGYNTLSGFEGWTAGEGNITYKPGDKLFVDAAKGDYHLVTDSVAKDKGKNDYWTESSTKDLDGYKRTMYTVIDMGVYEYQYTITAHNDTFDGKEHAAFTIETLEAGATASYIVDGETVADIPNFRDAGSHSLKVTVKREGYKDYVWTGTSTIKQAEITLSDIQAQDKEEYDALTAAEVTYSKTGGDISGTTVSVEYKADFYDAAGTNKDKNVGENKLVKIQFSLSGTDKDNYKLNITETTSTADIKPRVLTVDGTTIDGKVYDSTKAVTGSSAGNLVNVVSGEESLVSVSIKSAEFTDKNVGTKNVDVVYQLSGTGAANYTINPVTLEKAAKITKATVNISGTTAENKTYNAKTNATAHLAETGVSGIFKGDDASVSIKSADFEDKIVGTGKTVTVLYEINGDDSENYQIGGTNEVKADITKANLTVKDTTVKGKTYDGKTSVAAADITKGTLQGIQGTDTVSIGSFSGTYSDANAGSRTVTVKYVLTGDDAKNYTVSDSEHTDITISRRKLTVDGTTVESKYYDGTTDAEVNCGKLNLSNLVSHDTAMITSYTGTFADQWPGKDKNVTVSYTLDNANYFVADETKKADITLSLRVTTLADTVDPEDGVISLREAITYANAVAAQSAELKALVEGMTITFTDSLFTKEAPKGTITLTDGLTEIKYAYDIDGANRVTINGDGKYAIINVAGGSGLGTGTIGSSENPVTITGLTLTGGNGDCGSAVNAAYSYVTIKNSVITGNTANQNGGAVYTFSSTIAVTNSTLTGNSAVTSGGAVYFGNSSSATLVNNTIVGNTAATGAALCGAAGAAITTYNNLIVSNGTGTAANQLSNVTLTKDGCDYLTMTASSVFKTALPKTSAGYLTWIPALKGNNSVVNAGSMSDTVKDAFGVDKTQTDPAIAWAGIKDNYGHTRVTITSNPSTTVIDVGSYEIAQLESPVITEISEKENTITVTWTKVDDADGYLVEYRVNGTEEWTTASTTSDLTYTITGLNPETKYDVSIRATGSIGSWVTSEHSEIASEITEFDPQNWILSDYSGTWFKIDTTTDAAKDLWLNLYDKDGNILHKAITKTGRNLTVLGSDTAVKLTIGSGAMSNLGLINYTGNGDQCSIEGTPEVDVFTFDRETVYPVDPQEIANPYAVAVKNLGILKENGVISQSVYEAHKANYDKAYEQYKADVYKKSAITYETVALNEGLVGKLGGKVKLTGVRQISIDAKESDDVLIFNKFGADYNLIGGDGEDRIDFSNTSRVILNLGVSFKQYAVARQPGSITLHGDIEQVIGSAQNDEITSAANTTYINGNGGSDKLVLISDSKTSTAVDLSGNSQKVTALGDGIFKINLKDGAGSAVNAAAVSDKGKLELTAAGDNLFISGSAGADKIEVSGNNARISGNNGDDYISVIGSSASVSGGFGSDTIVIKKADGQSSGNNRVYGDAGDDFINLSGTDGNNSVYGGSGNDILIGGIGTDYLYAQLGNNVLIGHDGADYLYGGIGRDLLIANTTKLMKEKIGEESEKDQFYRELGAQWASDGDVDGITALIGKESITDDDVDQLISGLGDKNIIYSNNTTDNDFVSASLNDTVFSDEKDDISLTIRVRK